MKKILSLFLCCLMVLTLMGCGGSNGDDITTYTYSSELDIKNLDSSDADDGCSLKAIHAVIDGLTKTDKKGKKNKVNGRNYGIQRTFRGGSKKTDSRKKDKQTIDSENKDRRRYHKV